MRRPEKSSKRTSRASKYTLSPEERDEFRAALENVKPLVDDHMTHHHPTRVTPAQRARRRSAQAHNRQHATDPFSDAFMPALPEGILAWVADDEPAYLTKQLRRNDFLPGMVLDLHGYTRERARRELAEAITACVHEGLNCLNVIHGIGHGVLRQHVPGWLMQHPDVRAFHQAPLEWGGQGALLVLLRIAD
ncbi:endonuclease SmrB [Aliidiomarina sanyensis]|uniref:Endonuclease SmrB n=1 Tax=Aliidiomarina sanyensis TaxID=1249555 RepID=A0A432WES8_9GAMM|nr:endonuclease SmrB [Aliidiomarina sanyensis]RUO31330.1 endonuclease SmrB [Aliidiomarina sanyensis]